jgi:hypothetical protein
VLLTRLPLTPKCPFDLHVLSLPPAFALSQDQTLKLKSLNRLLLFIPVGQTNMILGSRNVN